MKRERTFIRDGRIIVATIDPTNLGNLVQLTITRTGQTQVMDKDKATKLADVILLSERRKRGSNEAA